MCTFTFVPEQYWFRGLWAHSWRAKRTLLQGLCPQITQSNVCCYLHLLQSRQMPAGRACTSWNSEATPIPSAPRTKSQQAPRTPSLLSSYGHGAKPFQMPPLSFDATWTMSWPWAPRGACPSTHLPQASPSGASCDVNSHGQRKSRSDKWERYRDQWVLLWRHSGREGLWAMRERGRREDPR